MGMTGGPAPMRAVSAASMGPVSVPSSLAPAPASTASTQGPNPGAAFAPEDFPSLGRCVVAVIPRWGFVFNSCSAVTVYWLFVGAEIAHLFGPQQVLLAFWSLHAWLCPHPRNLLVSLQVKV